MSIRSFSDQASEDICEGKPSKKARSRLPSELHLKARIRLASLTAATSLSDLRELKGNRLEALKGNRAGQFSLRINDQYRICFRWEQNDAFDVEIVDYH
ncbi:MAG TPA: type II toxin-antitoxin system RelE/ParE family toxin [Pyrinomonadaceae bacterium]|jgi:proteic killer suppression protein